MDGYKFARRLDHVLLEQEDCNSVSMNDTHCPRQGTKLTNSPIHVHRISLL